MKILTVDLGIPGFAIDNLHGKYMHIKNQGLEENDIRLSIIEKDGGHFIVISTLENSQKFSCSNEIPLQDDDI